MPLILALETSTKNCSVALAEGNEILAVAEEHSDQYIHSEKLHLFIRQTLQKAGKEYSNIEAIAVGKGPGSYTGLRIGVSAAKGLCYALSIPLLAMDGPEILVHQFLEKNSPLAGEVLIPMIDARRMEVYAALHDHMGERFRKIEAEIIDEKSYEQVKASTIHLLGDGSPKLRETLTAFRFVFHDLIYPSAKNLAIAASAKYAKKDFEDVAYFEPFYLKDFVAKKPKKLL